MNGFKTVTEMDLHFICHTQSDLTFAVANVNSWIAFVDIDLSGLNMLGNSWGVNPELKLYFNIVPWK